MATTCISDGDADLNKFRLAAASVGDINIVVEALVWMFDLSTFDEPGRSERLVEFRELFENVLSDDRLNDITVRLLAYRRMMWCIYEKGRDAITANESQLSDLFRRYVPLAIAEDNGRYLSGVAKLCDRMLRIGRTELQRAMSRFADDGNPHHDDQVLLRTPPLSIRSR